MPSQQQVSKTPADDRDEWRTPPFVVKWAAQRWGSFDLDLAANAENAVAHAFFSKGCSAFNYLWRVSWERAWCNPPYSDIGPWLAKAREETGESHFRVTFLLPAPNGAEWTSELQYALGLVFIVGRLAFLRPDGVPVKGNTAGSVLAHFGRRRSPFFGPSVEFVRRDDMR